MLDDVRIVSTTNRFHQVLGVCVGSVPSGRFCETAALLVKS